MTEKRMREYTILIHLGEGDVQFSASISSTMMEGAVAGLLDIIQRHGTHTEEEIDVATVHRDEDRALVKIGDREYYILTDEAIANEPPHVQEAFARIMKQSQLYLN